jgi:hypothetical protein
MAERLLYKNSCNLSSLIHLLTIHEENTGRYIRQQNNNDTNIVNLLNNVFTNNAIDISGSYNNRNERNLDIISNDGSVNTTYLDDMKYSDLSYCIYTTCPISREAFVDESSIIRIKACGHYFKKDSVTPWLRQSVYCPYCRATINNNESTQEANIINDANIYS